MKLALDPYMLRRCLWKNSRESLIFNREQIESYISKW